MQILRDLGGFLAAVFGQWQSWASGGGAGGVVVLVVNLGERLTGKSLSRRIYIVVFVGVFLAGAMFMAWREQLHRAEAAAVQTSDLIVKDAGLAATLIEKDKRLADMQMLLNRQAIEPKPNQPPRPANSGDASSHGSGKDTSEEQRVLELRDRIRASVTKAVRFPDAVIETSKPPTVFQTAVGNKSPRKLYDSLLQYGQKDIISALPRGEAVASFVGDYYQFERDALSLENGLVNRIGTMVAVRFRSGWLIYLRYVVYRLFGLTRDQIEAAGDFLNYSITWDDAEGVFAALRKGKEATAFVELSSRYQKFIELIESLKKDAGSKP